MNRTFFLPSIVLVVAVTGQVLAQTIRVPVHAAPPATDQSGGGPGGESPEKPARTCSWLPTATWLKSHAGCVSKDKTFDQLTNDDKIAYINNFFTTEKNLSYFNQIKSIYNRASSSATVSADLATLNFSNGMQMTAGTNVQAGTTNATSGTGAIPTLSSTSAAQATQNMLYGGTVFASALYPLFSTGAANINSPGNLGISLDILAKEGVDIQNFKSGTNTNVSSPPSHSSVQLEGYLLYNSINPPADSENQKSSSFAGSIFFGGSYGYNYMSHAYARDYGFGSDVGNGIGQVSAGMVINSVAKISISRAFGPSQTYIDSTSMAQTRINNFKAWSFGITYQSSPSTKTTK